MVTAGVAIQPTSGSEPGSEAVSGAGSAVTKPKRRFAPQLVEQTTRSSSNKKPDHKTPSVVVASASAPSTSDTGADDDRITHNATQKTEANFMHTSGPHNTSAARPVKSIRRFAPVPIETTFDSYRVVNKNPHGPAPEPTPDPSPVTSESSYTYAATAASITPETMQTKEQEKKPKRRFAPQLIETTTRVKRAGQTGPATKPVDKTDITPGTDHIYVPKPKRKEGAPGYRKSSNGLARRITENEKGEEVEEEASACFLTPRRQLAMKAHQNTRRGTRKNSYFPELDTIISSESGNSSEEEDACVAAPAINLSNPALSDPHSDHGDAESSKGSDLRSRRESCDEEFSGYLLGIAAREAHRQREFEQALSAFPNGMPPQGVEHFFARDNSEDDLQTGDGEPTLRHGPSQLPRRKSTDPEWAVTEMRAHAEKLARMRAETHLSLDDNSDQSGSAAPPAGDALWTGAKTGRRESRDSAIGSSMGTIATPSPALIATSPLHHDKPLVSSPPTGLRASPFGMPFALHAGKEEIEPSKISQAASPPMLGKDLSFRTCPSPKFTRMEPNQPYSQFERLERNQRDASGATGLWRGYCSSRTNVLDAPGLQPPHLLHTPGTSSSPTDSSFASVMECEAQSPARVSGGDQAGLHKRHLSGIDKKLEREMERREREEAMLAEFDDDFITQVYNYLSLGYMATARAFDDELSKISGICVEELRKDDNVKVEKGFMRLMSIGPSRSSTDSGSTDSSGDEPAVPFHRRPRHNPPRWKALKLYIHEWARQHPALNDDDETGPPAWGVRARRGSWAI